MTKDNLYEHHTRFQIWVKVLSKSLRLAYLSPNRTRRLSNLTFGQKCVAHPEFDPMIVQLLDMSLSRTEANAVWKAAFEKSKARADALLAHFDRQQLAIYCSWACIAYAISLALHTRKKLSRWQNTLYRASLTCSSDVVRILRKPRMKKIAVQ